MGKWEYICGLIIREIIMMDNKDKLLFELKTIISHLDEYKNALENGDEERLKALLEDGNQIKLRIDKRVKK